MNPCLRQASMMDLDQRFSRIYITLPPKAGGLPLYNAVLIENPALRALYDAEWQKRGFEKSP